MDWKRSLIVNMEIFGAFMSCLYGKKHFLQVSRRYRSWFVYRRSAWSSVLIFAELAPFVFVSIFSSAEETVDIIVLYSRLYSRISSDSRPPFGTRIFKKKLR